MNCGQVLKTENGLSKQIFFLSRNEDKWISSYLQCLYIKTRWVFFKLSRVVSFKFWIILHKIKTSTCYIYIIHRTWQGSIHTNPKRWQKVKRFFLRRGVNNHAISLTRNRSCSNHSTPTLIWGKKGEKINLVQKLRGTHPEFWPPSVFNFLIVFLGFLIPHR